jgi:hypothetical protein
VTSKVGIELKHVLEDVKNARSSIRKFLFELYFLLITVEVIHIVYGRGVGNEACVLSSLLTHDLKNYFELIIFADYVFLFVS